MQRTVAHLTRKFLPSTASFIRNQIVSHHQYRPVMIYKEYLDSAPARDILQCCPTLHLEKDKTGAEQVRSRWLYEKLRRLSRQDIDRSLAFIKEFDARILHLHFGTDAGMFHRVLKKSGLPSIVSFYGYDCSSFPRRLAGFGKKYLQAMVFPAADRILAMSPDMKNDLVQLGCPENKIQIHYHGSDTSRFVFDREYRDGNEARLLMLSQIEPKKGHHFLLQALKQARAGTRKGIILNIVGDGPGKERIISAAAALELGNVNFTPHVPYGSREHQELLRHSDIFVHPSVTAPSGAKEGIPGSIIEAMASGLAVISTYHAGIPYVIKNQETGLLVKEWDVEGLSKALVNLVEDFSLRAAIGKNGRRYAVDNLDLKRKQKDLEEIYDSML